MSGVTTTRAFQRAVIIASSPCIITIAYVVAMVITIAMANPRPLRTPPPLSR
jgi:hypothetical protein